MFTIQSGFMFRYNYPINKPILSKDSKLASYFPSDRLWVWVLPTTILSAIALFVLQFILVFSFKKKKVDDLPDISNKEKIM